MADLRSLIPVMRFPLPSDHQFVKVQTATATAAYTGGSSELRPAPQSCPAFLIQDSSLPNRMLQSLNIYLQSSSQGTQPPTPDLVQSIRSLRRLLSVFTLGHESTTRTLFERVFIPISYAVQDVDANLTLPEAATQVSSHNQIPDALYGPRRSAQPQVHVEWKSWSAFAYHIHQILEAARRGEVLELQSTETGYRSIVFKVGAYAVISDYY